MCSQDAGYGIGINRIKHDTMLNELADDLQHGQARWYHRRHEKKHGKVIGARWTRMPGRPPRHSADEVLM